MGPAQCLRVGPQLGEQLDPKPNCVGQVPTAGNVAIVSEKEVIYLYPGSERPATACICKPAGLSVAKGDCLRRSALVQAHHRLHAHGMIRDCTLSRRGAKNPAFKTRGVRPKR